MERENTGNNNWRDQLHKTVGSPYSTFTRYMLCFNHFVGLMAKFGVFSKSICSHQTRAWAVNTQKMRLRLRFRPRLRELIAITEIPLQDLRKSLYGEAKGRDRKGRNRMERRVKGIKERKGEKGKNASEINFGYGLGSVLSTLHRIPQFRRTTTPANTWWPWPSSTSMSSGVSISVWAFVDNSLVQYQPSLYECSIAGTMKKRIQLRSFDTMLEYDRGRRRVRWRVQ